IYNEVLPVNRIRYIKADGLLLNPGNEIVIHPETKRIEIGFTGICFTAPEKVQVRYILDGYDHEWIDPGKRQEAFYTSLPPGQYKFRIISCNNDGVWNNTPAELTITRKPFFYETAWFYILLAAAFIAVVFVVYLARVRNIKRRNLELEELVRKRTAEVVKQKEEIENQATKLIEINKELEKLSIVASETDNSVVIADHQGNLEWVNEGFRRLYGYSLEEFADQFGNSIIEASSNPKIREDIRECMRSKSSVVYESQATTKTGGKLWVQTMLNTILDENGEIRKIIAIESDISKLKKAEEEIRQRNKEILERNEEIKQQKEELQTSAEKLVIANEVLIKRNKQIMDSIVYAERIQKAILPDKEFMRQALPEHFVFFKPRDIVSGDFYWVKKIKNKTLVAVADCTGHGVPGAFMSIIGHNLLEQITGDHRIISPAPVLDVMRELMDIKFLGTIREDEIDDGMDIALCLIDHEKNMLEFAGALQNMIFIRDGILTEYKGNTFPIGKALIKVTDSFTNHVIPLQKNDTFYIFSDGYMDQFGGPRETKFYYANFRKILLEIHYLPIDQQKEKLHDTMKKWMYGNKQLDDMVIIGIKF
ncbi:MAG: PAS domain S-box protein, partial [Bacteroidetes bacterium]|nr:PAS domain S-box protein [Bacteroidota bacterium]